MGNSKESHRSPQRLRLLQRFRTPNAALLLRAAHEYMAQVFNVEIIDTELVLREDAVEELGQRGGSMPHIRPVGSIHIITAPPTAPMPIKSVKIF